MGRIIMAAEEALDGGASEVVVADANAESPVLSALEAADALRERIEQDTDRTATGNNERIDFYENLSRSNVATVPTSTRSGTEFQTRALHACVPLGHKHPAVHSAVSEQLEMITEFRRPIRTPNGLRCTTCSPTAPDPIDKTWLCNSGTEANEAALKFARSATGRSKIIATKRGFHGRTMGALAMTWKDKYKKPFEPLAGDVEFVPYDDSEALEEAVDEDTAAFIVEPVQGEGGIDPTSDGYSNDAREITEDAGAHSYSIEDQTGRDGPVRCGTPSAPPSRRT